MQNLTRFFWWCSGADRTLLDQCPSEKDKYIGIGATVFFTGVFASLGAAYALYTVFDSVWIAAATGLVWGLMIFNLDRYIVSSMRKEGKFSREFLSAVPRLVLAVLISVVIARPLEMKIFEKEIEPELVVMEQEAFKRQEQEVQARFETSLTQRRQAIQALKDEVTEKTRQRDALELAAREEADGTGGSRKKNLGPIYQVKRAQADLAGRELEALARKNDARIAELQRAADEDEAAVQQTIASLVRTRINGPAARLEALDRVASRSSVITWAHVFIMLLFITIECAPVLVKLMARKGPYDNLLRTVEHQFAVREAEDVATASSAIRERSSRLAGPEQTYLNDRLNAELN